MMSIEVDFEIDCADCGQSLDIDGSLDRGYTMRPCLKCIDQTYDKGVEDGYENCKKDNDL